MIGDPAGALMSLGSSVRLFVKKTRRELNSSGPYRAEGVRTLVQGIAGASFGTVSKVTGSLGIKLAAISGSEFKRFMGRSEPNHVGSGLYQAGSVFTESIKSGVLGLVLQPYKGIRQRSVWRTAKGVLMGVSGLALCPVVGALGATAKLSKGIESTTHLLDDVPVGRLRHARALFYHPQILPLHQETAVWTKLSVRVEGWRFHSASGDTEGSPQDQVVSTNIMIVFVVEYGKQKFSTVPQELRLSGRIAAEDVKSFELLVNPEVNGYATKVCVVVYYAAP